MCGAWAGDCLAILPNDVTPDDLAEGPWNAANKFGLHNFTDVGASVREMTLAGALAIAISVEAWTIPVWQHIL
jgi:hypothetical protein